MAELEGDYLEATYPVRTDETGPAGELSLGALTLYLQDAAARHAHELGFSVEGLRGQGKTWVLARFRIELTSLPRWRNSVRVRTWPSGLDRLFAFRDYLVLDAAGREIARADSAWLVINLENRRPVRFPAEFSRLVRTDIPRAFSTPFQEPEAPGHRLGTKLFRIGPADTDLNGHVGHVRMIEWLLAGIPARFHQSHFPWKLDIAYVGEAFDGDEVQLVTGAFSGADDSSFGHLLERPVDGRRLAVARTSWRMVEAGGIP